MAKQQPAKGGTSRIRFIMIDAEIPEGDLSQITSAIQNALKPTTIIQQRLSSQPATPMLISNDDDSEGETVDETRLDVEAEQPTQEKLHETREPRVRKPTITKVLEIDLKTGVSLESFVSEHPPKTEAQRNLVVAAYFKEHRNENAITVNHVYTCYRAMGWPSAIRDFSGSLRHLKMEKLMSSPGRGHYAINHLGLACVEKLGSE